MKDAGYETHMVGKWNLGSYHEDVLPHNRGFDSFMGYLTGEETYWSHQVRTGVGWPWRTAESACNG